MRDVAENVSADIPGHAGGAADLFGHPRGLTYLFTTEMWERFSYYGMRSLLVLYMTKYLLLADHSGNVVGLLGLKRALESVFGPLDVQPLSSQIWGLYTGLVYFTPIFGGLLADRVLGRRRTVVIGAVLMAFGHFMMAVEAAFPVRAVGADPRLGLLQAQYFDAGRRALCAGRSSPRPRLFDLLCRHQCRRVSGAADLRHLGRGSRLALRLCRRRRRHVHRALHLSLCAAASCRRTRCQAQAALAERRPLGRSEWRALVALLVLLVPNTLFWACYEQIGNTTILWIDADVDRTIDLFGVTAQIPTTWFLAFNPFMIFAFTPFVVALWARQSARGTEPSTVTKMALGCFGVTAANLIYAFAAVHAGGGQASWLWVARRHRRLHGRRALSVAGRAVARHQSGAGAHAVDDDGRVARHKFHRRLSGRLSSAASGAACRTSNFF